ncbi:unnamed protein product [Arabidopsis arenosa]|uniref:F-box family protein n=1 Tax=Arabidopsis arenosa TaxID=38785 RepID=A0A8S2AMF5_ARAAE|nr:unnamed protein product [Arabidopsis arenosa]
MTEIKSAMDTGVYDNQPSHESKDVAGFGSPPATTCVEKYHPQSVPDTKELYATNNPFLEKGPKAFRAYSSKDCWLPFEIVEEIISRAPIESVIRCKPTSKQCYALCNHKRFIYNHLNLSQERFMRIYSDNVEIINPATLDILSLPVPAEFNCVPCTRILSVIHCNGLLLCKWITGLRNVNVAVWNPVLGQVKFVDTSSHSALDIYGFGYDKDSYKILRISVRPDEFEIYDFKSKLWRAFSATMDWYLYTPDLKVSMNGIMYWLATTKGARIRETFIQSFDFSKETFKPICLVPFEWSRIDDAEAFSAFRGDRLSLFRQLFGDKDETREIEVWVTNKVTDGVVTLSKYFNVARPDLPILNPRFCRLMCVPTFFIHKTNSIMLWCDKIVGEGYACTSFYEIGRGEIKKQVETGQPFSAEDERNHCVCSFVYVPSLVPVPE